MIVFHNLRCGLTILRPDGSQYDSSKTITLTKTKVEELCPTSPTTTTPPPPLPFLYQQCANYSKSNFESRCIACEPAKPGEYPWQVELVVGSNSPLCGGSLITSKLVLTAAHCADINNFLDIVTVKLGHIDRKKGDGKEKTVMSKGIIYCINILYIIIFSNIFVNLID